MSETENIIEAVLFALGREISIEELSETLKLTKEEVKETIYNLADRFNDKFGVTLVIVNNKYQLVTNKIYYNEVSKFVENTKKQDLSNAAMETLSIIAYNPKITKAEIEKIRGVNSDYSVNRLLECGLIEEVARLNLPGRPAAYSTTSEFLKNCGINSIEELPKFEDISVKDEQMLITDYENKGKESENEIVEIKD